MTQLSDCGCVRGDCACVVNTGSQLHFDFTRCLYDELYSRFFPSVVLSYFYLMLKPKVCCLLINVMFSYTFVFWRKEGLSRRSRAREKDGIL